jgi:tRNA-specific 2-thiouridylase
VKNKKKKIFVGISGGVDSSVAAYLLKQEGYDVHGIFVKTWAPEWVPCTWVDEKRDAMRVCAALDIPFHFLDAEKAYKDGVAEYMIAEYKAGRTPNPDVLCNRVIKFGVMWEYAKAHGADAIATGHYAQIKDGYVAEAVDSAKDQSYFLWMLTKEDIAHTLFPLGHLEKKEVRAIAKKAGLFTSEKKDSQGICFLGAVDMKDFLLHYIEQKKGVITTEDGTVVGEHDGVWFHTIGERHGFRITKQTTDQKPYFVVGKNVEANILIVSHNKTREGALGKAQTLFLRDGRVDTAQMPSEARIRYHGVRIPITLKTETEVLIETTEPIALGQSLVMYRDDILVGGGIIDSISV